MSSFISRAGGRRELGDGVSGGPDLASPARHLLLVFDLQVYRVIPMGNAYVGIDKEPAPVLS
jgi:hypothetical protein